MAKTLSAITGYGKWLTMDIIYILERKYGCPIWQMRDRQTNEMLFIPLSGMDAIHMTNSYKLLARIRHQTDLHYRDMTTCKEMEFLHQVHDEVDYVQNIRPALTGWINDLAVWMHKKGIPIPELDEVPRVDRNEMIEEAISILEAIAIGGNYANWREARSDSLPTEDSEA